MLALKSDRRTKPAVAPRRRILPAVPLAVGASALPAADRRRRALVAVVLAGGALASPAAAPAAVLQVTTVVDVDAAEGQCSLREAIIAANGDVAYRECPAGAGADEIEITVAGTIALVADLPQVQQALNVRGLGPAESVIDGGDVFEIFHFTGAAAGNGELLRIEGLQLKGGSASEGGAVYAGANRTLEVVDSLLIDNQSNLVGGAIFGDGAESVLIVRSSLITNTAGGGGGGLGVQNGMTTIVDSTLAGNTASGGPGGAIYALLGGQVTVLQSTLSGNQSSADGGGLAAVATAARVESSTVVGNLADADADDTGDGGGVSVAGAVTATLVNSLIAGNEDLSGAGGSACPDGLRKLGGTMATEGFNLVGANDCFANNFPPGQPNVNGDQVGTAATPIDPLLGPLDDHGGPTLTSLPLPASPAIDQGSCPAVAADQRGYGNGSTGVRVVDDPAIVDLADGCDVGAVETGAVDVSDLIFADDFESGDTSRWSSVTP